VNDCVCMYVCEQCQLCLPTVSLHQLELPHNCLWFHYTNYLNFLLVVVVVHCCHKVCARCMTFSSLCSVCTSHWYQVFII